MEQGTIKVYTEAALEGTSVTLTEGDHSYETLVTNYMQITGTTSAGSTHVFDYENGTTSDEVFPNNLIKSVLVGPFTKVTFYDITADSGRNMLINNNSSEELSAELSSAQFTFADTISHITIEKITAGSSFKQTITVVDRPVEGFSAIDTAEEHNVKVIALVILIIACIFCFIMGGCFGGCLSRPTAILSQTDEQK